MTRGAQPSHLAHPPADAIVWKATRRRWVPGVTHRLVFTEEITAKTWFEARALALVALQCEAHEVTVEPAGLGAKFFSYASLKIVVTLPRQRRAARRVSP